MESVDLSHADERGLLGWVLPRLASGVEALNVFSAPLPSTDDWQAGLSPASNWT